MENLFPLQKTIHWGTGSYSIWLSVKFGQFGWYASLGHNTHILAVIIGHEAKRRTAQMQCLFQDSIEYRREVAGRGIDDPQHLGGCGLLFKGLALLSDEPRVLHRDDRLRREILQQRDL